MSDRKYQIAELIDRLMEYQETRRALRKCYEECHSSPSYYCRDEAEARDRALDSLVQAFDVLLGAGEGA